MSGRDVMSDRVVIAVDLSVTNSKRPAAPATGSRYPPWTTPATLPTSRCASSNTPSPVTKPSNRSGCASSSRYHRQFDWSASSLSKQRPVELGPNQAPYSKDQM